MLNEAMRIIRGEEDVANLPGQGAKKTPLVLLQHSATLGSFNVLLRLWHVSRCAMDISPGQGGMGCRHIRFLEKCYHVCLIPGSSDKFFKPTMNDESPDIICG